MKVVSLKGASRTEFGKKANKALRKEELVPCVIYGGGQPVHFSAKSNDFRSLIFTPDFKLAEIEIEGKTYKCILKATQFHPVTDNLEHVDFIELVPGKTIKTEIPVAFTGTSPGEKTGGKLIQSLRRVKVKTTPEKLVDKVLLDISTLQLGHAIRVRDIEFQEGVEIINAPGIPVAAVEIPRVLRSDDDDADDADAEEKEEEDQEEG